MDFHLKQRLDRKVTLGLMKRKMKMSILDNQDSLKVLKQMGLTFTSILRNFNLILKQITLEEEGMVMFTKVSGLVLELQ